MLEEQNMIISEQDSGRTIRMNRGGEISVHLKENPSTGYQWSVESAEGMEQLGEQFETNAAIGGTGVHTFRFRMAQAGSHQLRIKHWRIWEGESSVIAHFAATIIVE
jgi:inhibitor of cysteine peptidase